MDLKSKNPFMPIHPDEAAMQGIHVPLIIGHTSQENLMLVNRKYHSENIFKSFAYLFWMNLVNDFFKFQQNLQ